MKFLKPAHVLCGVLVLLTACGALGLAQPKSIVDRIGYANSQVTAVADSATVSLRGGRITQDDARHVLTVGRQTGEVLDLAAVAVGQGELSTAEARLQMAEDLLKALEVFLQAKEQT